MNTIEVPGVSYSYLAEDIATLAHLHDLKKKISVVVSTRKSDLRPFKGQVFELAIPTDALVVDLAKRSKIYGAITNLAPSLKTHSLIRKHMAELALGHLLSTGKLKELPKSVQLIQSIDKELQVNVVPVSKLFA